MEGGKKDTESWMLVNLGRRNHAFNLDRAKETRG
jgi:hypothetical protein